jgi:predicted CXXCH cytochrome family protein
MHAAGVTCSDCHDPHSLALRASGDGLCAGCHSSDIFAVEAHHRHAPADTAPGCVDCHMRAATYMQVDDRRDHSFRVPRPDLSAELGVPNACNDCHADRDAAWAAAIVAGWYPAGRGTVADPASAFAAVRNWQAGALATLLPIAVDPALAPIVRATAVSELGAAIGSVEAGVLAQLAADPSDLVRLALIDASRELAPSRRIPLVQRFLSDAPLALRIAAAEALQSVRAELGPGRQSDLDAAIVDGLAARAFGSDQPQGLLGRAETLAIGGRVADARRWLEVAVGRFPWFAPAWVNLADLERAGGRDRAALEIVDAGLAVVPEADALHIARGLALVRLGQLDAAVAAFADARRLAPDSPYNAYIYAIALNSTGDTATALAELESAASSFPAYADLWYALATISRDAGNLDDAIAYARRGRAGVPSDPRFDALLASFGAD